jgi:hypothetical protein
MSASCLVAALLLFELNSKNDFEHVLGSTGLGHANFFLSSLTQNKALARSQKFFARRSLLMRAMRQLSRSWRTDYFQRFSVVLRSRKRCV